MTELKEALEIANTWQIFFKYTSSQFPRDKMALVAKHFLETFTELRDVKIENIRLIRVGTPREIELKKEIRNLRAQIKRSEDSLHKVRSEFHKFKTASFKVDKTITPNVKWGRKMTLAHVEKTVINEALKAFNGNRVKTAKALGVSLRTIKNKLREYGQTKPKQECKD